MRSVLGTLLLVFVIICIGAVAQAHQVNLSTARVGCARTEWSPSR